MASAYTTSLIQTFLQAHAQDIVNALNNTGLFFAAVVAQLSVESENGTSSLASKYNNYGGVKGNSSNGVLLSTTEGDSRTATKAWFKTYDSFADFMSDYVGIFQSPDYVNAGVFTATTPQQQITAMVNAGYSTMSASNYLASGINDRIGATQSLVKIGKISNMANAYAAIGSQCAPPVCYSSVCSILNINNVSTCGG